MNNKKGFTLAELLITIVILGIITGLSIPVLRALQASQTEKKYTVYMDSVGTAAKLYTDSYSDDLFNGYTSGCTYIKYKDLSKYKLLKDISVSGMSCDTNYTFVKVVRFNDKYFYKPYIGCGAKTNGGVKAEIFKPTKPTASSVCGTDAGKMISVSAEPASSESKTNKQVSPIVKLISETGVKNSPPVLSYGYSRDNSINVISGWTQLSFNIPKETVQERLISEGTTQVFKAKGSGSSTPNESGEFYLVIRVDTLENLDRQPWRNVANDSDRYIILGPYLVDVTPPEFNDSQVISTSTKYNSKTPKLDLKVTDNISGESDLKMCYAYEGEDDCPIPKDGEDLTKLTRYEAYNKNKVLKKIADTYNGTSRDIKIWVSDAAGNVAVKTFTYSVSMSYKLSFNTDGGTTCSAGGPINQIENYMWKENIVTNDTTFSNRTFCKTTKTGYSYTDWYTGKKGTGTKVTGNSKATANRTVYPNWTPKTVKVTFACNGGSGGGVSTYTYDVTGQRFNRTCTRRGYTLDGWTLGSNTYTVNNGVSNAWINAHSPSVTVHAKWTPIVYHITYTLNGGTTTGNPTTYTVETPTFTLKNSTRNGYIFTGWTGTGLSGATKPVTIQRGSIGDRSYAANWSAKTVKVTYACSGGTGGGSETFIYGVSGQKFTKTCSRAGYRLLGWSLNGSTYSVNNSVSNSWIDAHSPSVTVTARWEIITYTITYNLRGGTVSGNPATYNINTATFTLKNPTREGHNFQGWTGTGLSSATKTVTVRKGSTGNRTYNATWNLKPVYITYKPNGGTGTMANTTCYYGQSCTASTNQFTYTGRRFVGWYLNTAGTGQKYTTFSATGNLTLYAKWELVTYSISYNLDGGTVSPANPTGYNINTATFTLNNPTKTGGVFEGWTGTGLGSRTKTVTISKGSTGARSYKAEYSLQPITITYKPNGGTGTMPNTTCYYGQNCTAATNKFTYTGRKFVGWYLNAAGTGDKYTTFKATGNLTLYAKWELETYNITYTLNGGTVSPANPGTYNIATASFKLNNPTRVGHNFQGWTGTGISSATKTVTVAQGSTGARTYTANWKAKTVVVTFNCNGGTGGGSQTFTYGVSGQKFNKPCTKLGYTQDGWTFNDNGTTRTYTNNNGVSDSWINTYSPSVTLNAKWKVATYTITYNLGGGTVSPANPTSYNINTATFTLRNPKKEPGYNFVGWTGTGLSRATKTVTISKGSTGNRSYTANYNPKTVVVTFNCGGASGGGTQTFTYGVSGQRFNKSCAKTGYTQDGWTLGSNTYAINNAVSDGWINTYSPSVTLNAKFKLATYKCNPGYYLKKYATSCNTPCLQNYYCLGGTFSYSTTKDQGLSLCITGYPKTNGTGKKTAADCYMEVAANRYVKTAKDTSSTACPTGYTRAAHTVQYGSTSKCNANSFTVTYNANGGRGSMSNTTCTYDANCSLRTNAFTRDKYTFLGWATSATGNVVYTNGASIKNALTSGNLTLYARWKSNNITFRVRLKSGETIKSQTVYNGSVSNWTYDNSGLLYRNGVMYGAEKSRGTSVNVDLPNYGYDGFINISKPYYGASWDTAWKCESGCRRSNQLFTQGEVYMNLDDIVADNNLDGIIVLNVNWRPAAVLITVGVNGGTITSSPINPSNAAYGDRHYYLGDGGETVYKSDQGTHHHELAVGASLGTSGLVNYNNPDWLYISPPSGKRNPRSGEEWKGGSNCAKSVYSQSKVYTSSDFCTPGIKDCVCHIRVKWRN